jgi:DNA-binding transcriptional LysR family regulator
MDGARCTDKGDEVKSTLHVLERGGVPALRAIAAVPRPAKPLIRSQLKMRQLAFLVRLDEERSLTRAAAAADLGQPAASKLLRQIERALDVKLFERHARGMEPTCYGEILIRHARLALSALGLARQEIAALKSGLSGRVDIGTIMDPGTTLVPAVVARLKQRNPGLLVTIELESSRKLVARLLAGHLDVVVGRVLDSACAEELHYEPLAPDEPHAILASASHPLAGRNDLQLASLVNESWILPPVGSHVRDKLMALFKQEGLPVPTAIVEAPSVPIVAALLHQTNMVVALPEQAVRAYCTADILTVLMRNLPLKVGAFGLITHRGRPLSPSAELTVSMLRDLAKQTYRLRGLGE